MGTGVPGEWEKLEVEGLAYCQPALPRAGQPGGPTATSAWPQAAGAAGLRPGELLQLTAGSLAQECGGAVLSMGVPGKGVRGTFPCAQPSGGRRPTGNVS